MNIKSLKEFVQKYVGQFVQFATSVIDSGKKKQSSFLGWLKTGAILLGLVTVGIGIVALISAFVVFCLSIPGLLFGSILWAAWTWAGLGAELFPQLDPRWLALNWEQFFWIATIVYYVGRLLGIRKSKSGAPKHS